MKVGFAQRSITPLKSMPMAGFDRRTGCSDGVLDDLMVSVLALEDSAGIPFLFCSFDLLGIDSVLCEQLREFIHRQQPVSPRHICFFATHTHSGPSNHYFGRKGYDDEYVAVLLEKANQAAAAALADLQPSTVLTAATQVTGVASLRNTDRSHAADSMPLRLVTFQREHDKIIGCLFACHPTVLDEKNTLFSKDLPGAAAAFLSAKSFFVNGACADVSTRFTRRSSSPEELTRLGSLMGNAISAAPFVKDEAFGRHICAVQKEILLSRGASIAGDQRNALLRALREKAANCKDAQERREFDSRIAVLERPPAAAEEARRVRISAVHFGSAVLLTLPFELDSRDGQKLMRQLQAAADVPVLIACYTGGYDGYLPSGKPLDITSSYEDIASRYLPQTRNQVWEGAMQCVVAAKNGQL